MLAPGPETDLAVAKACGIPERDHSWDHVGTNHYGTSYVCSQCGEGFLDDIEPEKGPCPFRPSTDIRDAFVAAERFTGEYGGLRYKSLWIAERWDGKLLTEIHLYFGQHAAGGWGISTDCYDGRSVTGLRNVCEEWYPTCALAICAAILKLAEARDAH